MIQCDVFDLSVRVEGRRLLWSVSSDLPGGTRVIVSVSRHYTSTDGRRCLWMLWNDAVLLGATGPGSRQGAVGSLGVDEGDARALAQFNSLLVPYSSGIATPVGDEVHVEAVVGARQPIKAFGKGNCNLCGAMVTDVGGLKVVHVAAFAQVPLNQEYQPIE